MSEQSITYEVEAIAGFTKTLHNSPYEDTDPAKVKLPSNFVVVVLGSSRGIGARIAIAFAKAGAKAIYGTARSTKSLGNTKAEIQKIAPQTAFHALAADLTKHETLKTVADTVKDTCGRLDAVVVSGGIVLSHFGCAVGDTNPDDFAEVMNTNSNGTQAAAYHFLPLLRATKDGPQAFLNVNSLAGGMTVAPLGRAEYGISKLAASRLIEHIHQQYHQEGIFAAAIHPGSVLTDMNDDVGDDMKHLFVDTTDLCGAFCVWLVKEKNHQTWLGGRMTSAQWDVKELEARKEEIVEKNLLKIQYAV